VGFVTVGIRIGDRRTPTALAVVEGDWRDEPGATPTPRVESGKIVGMTPARQIDYALVRRLERLPAGTTYPAITARLGVVMEGLRARGTPPTSIYADATGIGLPIIDGLSQAARRPVTAVYMTAGDKRVVADDRRSVTLGKAYVVARLKVLLEGGRLLLPRTREAEELADDLAAYDVTPVRVDDQAAPFAVGAHDDDITALGLAVQEPPMRQSIVWS